jgi:hypothetical protein
MREPFWARVRGLWLWPARIGTAAAMFALLAVLGHFPMAGQPGHGLLRLAWRMSGAQVRLCRERSQEELLRLPPHMRQAQACDEVAVPYRLSLRLNGEERLERVVRPRGAKSDRPIYVAEDFRLEPGTYRIDVRFEPDAEAAEELGEEEDRDAKEGADRPGHEGHALREAIARAPRYALSQELVSSAGRIVLVELDESAKELRMLGQ